MPNTPLSYVERRRLSTPQPVLPVKVFDGRKLKRMTKSQRAAVAVLARRDQVRFRPTDKIAAGAAGVSLAYYYKAAQLTENELLEMLYGGRTMQQVTGRQRFKSAARHIGLNQALEILATVEEEAA
jgi:hypothetical protein